MLRQKVIKIRNLKSCQILCAHKHCFLMPNILGVSIIRSVPVTEKAPSDSSLSENNNTQPVGSEEPVAVKEDEVFASSSDGAKQLKGQMDSTTQPAVTPPPMATPTITSVGDVMKNDTSPAAVKKATPKTQPLPPATSAIPSVSTGNLEL